MSNFGLYKHLATLPRSQKSLNALEGSNGENNQLHDSLTAFAPNSRISKTVFFTFITVIYIISDVKGLIHKKGSHFYIVFAFTWLPSKNTFHCWMHLYFHCMHLSAYHYKFTPVNHLEFLFIIYNLLSSDNTPSFRMGAKSAIHVITVVFISGHHVKYIYMF